MLYSHENETETFELYFVVKEEPLKVLNKGVTKAMPRAKIKPNGGKSASSGS